MTSSHDDTVASSLPAGGGGDGFSATGLVANRYQIVRWLGGGGMGRVYEAHDTELDERVALKVLRAGMPEEAIERFRREVKLTRKIMHPNVARMFDIGEHAGDKFLTMELVDGMSLAHELGKAMTWERLRDVGIQVATGLAAAHAAGVIHRDLKPDNVLVETATGRIVITDFGIARTGDDSANVTQLGEVVGTPRYMAPEQLAGLPLDARADLFAFGVMMYELATGQRPWQGDNAVAIAVAQATQAARPMTAKVPGELAAIIEACLRIEAAERPASASVLVTTLAGVSLTVTTRAARPTLAPSPTPSPALPTATGATTLAVLPFGVAPGDEYLAEGLREDLIDTLSTTAMLRVRPAGSVPPGCDPRAIGHALQVDHVVSGSVRRAGDHLRISARLVGVADGFQIWAHRRDCTDAEILAVCDELAHGIAGALSTRAVSVERPTDPRAVELYLRARHELRRFWGEHAITAANLLAEAVAIAPNQEIADAYAYACVQAWSKSGKPELLPRAEAVVVQALATGGPEARLAAAVMAWAKGDSVTMAQHLGAVLVRAPMNAQAHEIAGRMLLEVGTFAEGRKHLDIVLGIEPQRSAVVALELARAAAFENDWDGVERLILQLTGDPDPAFQRIGAMAEARLFGWRGDLDRVLRAATRLFVRNRDSSSILVDLLEARHRGEPLDEAAWALLMSKLASGEYSSRQRLVTYQRAIECVALCDRFDCALEALARANDDGLIDRSWIDLCPILAPYAGEPRWEAQRAIVHARADRVLAAYREASR